MRTWEEATWTSLICCDKAKQERLMLSVCAAKPVSSNPAPSTSSPLTVARITRLAIDNNHPPVPSSPHLLGTSSPWLQTTDSSAVWTQAPLDEEPSTAVRRTLRAPEGTGSRQ
ncbi:hypothetical protein MGG_17806 [Pyricularia oryzae 70-15]|uniref:Uncharacterized protein n=2 Tax=Pyricularia TaxID=48558 RepID=G4NI60_PYRO7|nr:uncharacterized protein MGG_17806 [Pyricularia oryzae 70-15]EHA47920.1 hypothetical protein MGG_17806 [Pyricularia oryzae 70-15]